MPRCQLRFLPLLKPRCQPGGVPRYQPRRMPRLDHPGGVAPEKPLLPAANPCGPPAQAGGPPPPRPRAHAPLAAVITKAAANAKHKVDLMLALILLFSRLRLLGNDYADMLFSGTRLGFIVCNGAEERGRVNQPCSPDERGDAGCRCARPDRLFCPGGSLCAASARLKGSPTMAQEIRRRSWSRPCCGGRRGNGAKPSE